MALQSFRSPAGIGVGSLLHGAAVVQQVNGQLMRRIVDLGCGDQRDPEQVGFLVVARYENVNAWQQIGILGERDLCPLDRTDVNEHAEQVDGHALKFCQIQQDTCDEAGTVHRGNGVQRAPGEVADRYECDQHKKHDTQHTSRLDDVQDRKAGESGRSQQVLAFQSDILGREPYKSRDMDRPQQRDRQRGAFVRKWCASRVGMSSGPGSGRGGRNESVHRLLSRITCRDEVCRTPPPVLASGLGRRRPASGCRCASAD